MFHDPLAPPTGLPAAPDPLASVVLSVPPVGFGSFGSGADGDPPDAWGCEAALPFLVPACAFMSPEAGADPPL